MKIYALKSKKKNCLMDFSFSSNGDGDLCNDCSCELSSGIGKDANLWLHQSFEVASKIAGNPPTEWYNSCYEQPKWDCDYYGELEVVCINEIFQKVSSRLK